MKTLITLVLVTLALLGCSSNAQLVRSDPTGGRVALEGAFMPAMSKAHALMAEHCHGRFDTLEQTDAVTFMCRNPAATTSNAQLAVLDATRSEAQ